MPTSLERKIWSPDTCPGYDVSAGPGQGQRGCRIEFTMDPAAADVLASRRVVKVHRRCVAHLGIETKQLLAIIQRENDLKNLVTAPLAAAGYDPSAIRFAIVGDRRDQVLVWLPVEAWWTWPRRLWRRWRARRMMAPAVRAAAWVR